MVTNIFVSIVHSVSVRDRDQPVLHLHGCLRLQEPHHQLQFSDNGYGYYQMIAGSISLQKDGCLLAPVTSPAHPSPLPRTVPMMWSWPAALYCPYFFFPNLVNTQNSKMYTMMVPSPDNCRRPSCRLSCFITFEKEIKREERDTPVNLPNVLLERLVVPRHILYSCYIVNMLGFHELYIWVVSLVSLTSVLSLAQLSHSLFCLICICIGLEKLNTLRRRGDTYLTRLNMMNPKNR